MVLSLRAGRDDLWGSTCLFILFARMVIFWNWNVHALDQATAFGALDPLKSLLPVTEYRHALQTTCLVAFSLKTPD